MEHGGTRSGQTAAIGRYSRTVCARNLRPAAFCISGRANGIRENRCRAGRSVVTGAPTECRSGTIRSGSPIPAQIMASARPRRSDSRRNFPDVFRISPEYLVAAYEDPLAYMLKERDLPVNVDPMDNKLDDPEERERLRRVFERGSASPWVSCCRFKRGNGKNGPEWQTGLWMLRSRHLFLLPGDSPVGLRLPLQSLPWEPADEIQKLWVVDPMAPSVPLPVFAAIAQRKLETVSGTVVAASRKCGAHRIDRRTARRPHVRIFSAGS